MNIAKQYLARRGDVGDLKLAAEQNMQFEPRAANSEAVASCTARLAGAPTKNALCKSAHGVCFGRARTLNSGG